MGHEHELATSEQAPGATVEHEAPSGPPTRRTPFLLARLPPVDGASVAVVLPEGTYNLVILNTLAAAIHVRMGLGAAPSATDHDWTVPTLEIATLPAWSKHATLLVKYPGAVPAGDVGLAAPVVASPVPLAAFQGL